MSQSLSCIWIHIVFSTKKRKPFLRNKDIQDKLYQYIIGTSKALNVQICSINRTEDHVHMLVNIPRIMSTSEYIKKIKNSSSKMLKSHASEFRYLTDFYWQSGYAAFSVSESNVEKVKNYIKNQKLHHKKIDYMDELKQFLRIHNVKYNDKYLVD